MQSDGARGLHPAPQGVNSIIANLRDLNPEELTGPLLRAARALTGQRADAVAAATLVSLSTIKRAEAAVATTALTRANLVRLVAGYADCGVQFFGDDVGHIGVKLLCTVPVTRGEADAMDQGAEDKTAPDRQGRRKARKRPKTELPKFLSR